MIESISTIPFNFSQLAQSIKLAGFLGKGVII